MGCGGARVGQMPSSMTFIALVVGAVGGCLNLFSLVYFFFFFFFSFLFGRRPEID